MEFRITCSGCGKRYRVGLDLIGKFLKCKRCETFMEIRDPSSEPAVSAQLEEDILSPGQPVVDGQPTPSQPAKKRREEKNVARPAMPTSPVVSMPPELDAGYDPLAGSGLPVQPSNPVVLGQTNSLPAPPMAMPLPSSNVPMAAGAQPLASNVWQNQGAAKNNVPVPPGKRIGGPERACILLGGFLLVLGLCALLLPIFGIQFSRLQGTGRAGLIVGLLLGLVGTALLATGLRKIKIAPILGGAGGAVATFAAFGLAMLLAKNVEVPDIIVDNGQSGSTLASGISPWMKNYPDWKAIGTNVKGGGAGTVGTNASDKWPEQDLTDVGLTARFPSDEKVERSSGKQNLDGDTVDVSIYRHSFVSEQGAFLLAIRYFEAPNPEFTEERILEDVETAFRSKMVALEYQSSKTTVDQYPAKEISYRTKSDGNDIRVHQRVIVRNTSVFLIFVSGPVSLVPGGESRKFLRSVRFDKAWRPPGEMEDAGPGTASVLDPFAEANDGNSTGESNASPPTGHFKIPVNEQSRERKISLRRRKLESEMDEELGMRARLGFAAAYLTESLGNETNSRSFYAHPGKHPITAIDITTAERGNEKALRLISPIYDRKPTDGRTLIAKDGYGVGAINVNLQEREPGVLHVAGIQFVFMKVTDKGFLTSERYMSDWFGQKPAEGDGATISSDGRPVYGFWVRSGLTMNAIGLIVEAEYKP